jgi:hypothetical protein
MCTCGECLTRNLNGQNINPSPPFDAERALEGMRVALHAAVRQLKADGVSLVGVRRILYEISEACGYVEESDEENADLHDRCKPE